MARARPGRPRGAAASESGERRRSPGNCHDAHGTSHLVAIDLGRRAWPRRLPASAGDRHDMRDIRGSAIRSAPSEVRRFLPVAPASVAALGLEAALQRMVEGFGRVGAEGDLEVCARPAGQPPDRAGIGQGGAGIGMNVHRHARPDGPRVRLPAIAADDRARVEDDGVGLPEDGASCGGRRGVGIPASDEG